MNAKTLLFLVVVGAAVVWAGQDANAQHYGGGYHIDHHDHIYRDSHGHVIGRQHHDVIHSNHAPHYPHAGHHYPDHHHPRIIYPQPTYPSPQHDVHHEHPSHLNSSHPHPTEYRSARPINVTFGGFSHVDELASQLESLTSQMLQDLHYNYSHNPGFQQTYREAYEIYQIAKYIHAAEHRHDRDAIASRLGGLDADFHHIQNDVKGWTRHHHRQVGQLGILTKMDRVESALHHLMNDVGVQSAVSGAGQQPPAPAGGAPSSAGGFAPTIVTSPPPGN